VPVRASGRLIGMPPSRMEEFRLVSRLDKFQASSLSKRSTWPPQCGQV
jgi:hypothetical protein